MRLNKYAMLMSNENRLRLKPRTCFQDKATPAAKPRNPAPVSNPDKGSHYLKKSPSPTGIKSPPGVAPGDFLQKKNVVAYGQQVT